MFSRYLLIPAFLLLIGATVHAQPSSHPSATLGVKATIPVIAPTITIDPTWELPFKGGKLGLIYKPFKVRGNGALALSLKQNALLTRRGGTETIELQVQVYYGNANGIKKSMGSRKGLQYRAILNYVDSNHDLGEHAPLDSSRDRFLSIEPTKPTTAANTRAGTYSAVVELVLEASETDFAIATPVF